jgi:hypothetical protein
MASLSISFQLGVRQMTRSIGSITILRWNPSDERHLYCRRNGKCAVILNPHSQRLLETITYLITAILLSLNVSQAQQSDEAPFVIFEKAIKDERGGLAGNKEHLSTVFNAERKRLGDRFESELMKWLGSDVERHYWMCSFSKVKVICTAINRCYIFPYW